MKLVGLMLARNEDWIIRQSITAALTWVDELVILDHASSDLTADVIAGLAEQHPGRIHRLYSDDQGWPEMSHRQRTLAAGRQLGGTHFAIIDADEILSHNLIADVRQWFERLSVGETVDVPMVAVWRSLSTYRVDPCVWSSSVISIGWRDNGAATWMARHGYQHHARLPKAVGERRKVWPCDGGVLHYQFADNDRLRWKHRWYKLHEAVAYQSRSLAEINKQYNLALDERRLELRELPNHWRWPEELIVVGTEPWHAAACVDLYKQAASIDRLAGLDLWGWSC